MDAAIFFHLFYMRLIYPIFVGKPRAVAIERSNSHLIANVPWRIRNQQNSDEFGKNSVDCRRLANPRRPSFGKA